jgi:hypothetical protein
VARAALRPRFQARQPGGRDDYAEVGASRDVGRVTGYRSASAAASKSEGDYDDAVTPGVRITIA